MAHDEGGRAVGSLLRRHRMLAGLSQEALAERSGLSRRGIADLERGARRYPYPDTAQRLAASLGLDGSERIAFLAACRRPDQSSWTRRHTLQVEPSGLIGRERELDELESALNQARLLTLTGTGGIGKTRLALELGRRVQDNFASGAIFVDLSPVLEPALIPHTIAHRLGVTAQSGATLADALRDFIGNQNILVVLDNCEHVLTTVAPLADTLIRACPMLRVVATSREAMHIHVETAWPVQPLSQAESVGLFISRVHAANATLRVSDEDGALVRDVCARLEGIPLAIELAAARVPALGLATIAALLEDRLQLLSRGSRLDPPRHRTLRAAIDWSYALLSEQEQRLLAQLSVFAGGWDLDAASSVCDFSDVLDALSGLVDKSLVMADERDGRMRYRMLKTIRVYAAERLGSAADVRRRHAVYYRGLAETGSAARLGIRYPDMQRVSREHDNMRAALRTTLDSGDLENGLGLCHALSGFWLAQGHLREGEEWLARFLSRAEDEQWSTLSEGLRVAGRLAQYAGAPDRARGFFERSLGASRTRGDVVDAARALCGLGDIAMHQGAYRQAYDTFQESLRLAQEVNSRDDTALALLSLGRAAVVLGDTSLATTYFEQALRIYRDLQDRWGVGSVLNDLGLQARRTGQLERAQALHEESHVLWRQSGTRMGERAALMNLALITLERGALDRSAALTLQALDMCRNMADASAVTIRCVEIAAEVLGAVDAHLPAVRGLAAAAAWRQVAGAPVPPQEQVELDAVLAGARARLSASEFDASCTTGTLLSLEEAVELASTELTALLESRSR